MKLSELLDTLHALQTDSEDPEVHFSYDYGDHWRTQVAPKVLEVVEGRVEHSEYHRMAKVVDEDESGYDKATEVIIIS